MSLDKVLYTAHANVTGGRDGTARTSDGRLNVKLSTPGELSGAGADGTNPEQLFAAGYAACFLGAMKVVAARGKTKLPDSTWIASSVGIGPSGPGFGIAVSLTINAPDLDRAQAESIVEQAHRVCPYSNATRGNIDVTLSVA